MKILCPHCEQKYEVDDQFLGITVQCHSCKQDFALADNYHPVLTELSDDQDELQTKNPFTKGRLLVFAVVAMLAIFWFGYYLYTAFLWQGSAPTTLAGYTLGGEVTNVAVLLDQYQGTVYNAKVLESDDFGVEFPICRLNLLDGADGVRIKGVVCLNENAGPHDFETVVNYAKNQFGRPNGVNAAEVKSWHWQRVEFTIQLTDKKLYVKLTPKKLF